MNDALAEAKHRVAPLFDKNTQVNLEPVMANPWVVSSLLQKSIRRGEVETAQRAALTFFKLKGSAIWRRFLVIAFEDIGIGSTDALITAASASDPIWRKTYDDDAYVVLALARIMAEAPKDRSSDYIVSAGDHPFLRDAAPAFAALPLETKLAAVSDTGLSLPHLAVALRSIWPTGRPPSSLAAVYALFRSLGVPEQIVVATAIAAARTREPITLMVPLIFLAARNPRDPVTSVELPVPRTFVVGDVPMYALDSHTRIGREAIWQYVCENETVRDCLQRYVPRTRWRTAAHCAAYYADAAPVSRRLMWDQSESMEAFGIERDLAVAGVTPEGYQPLLQTMRDNLDHLNRLRAVAFLLSRPLS